MAETFDDLRGFMDHLSRRGELVRVRQEVDPELEVNAILDRLARSKGPAVLFEKVKGSSIPVFGNAFGTFSRVSQAFGAEDFGKRVEAGADKVFAALSGDTREFLLGLRAKGVRTKFQKLKKVFTSPEVAGNLRQLGKGSAVLPVEVARSACPCKQVILKRDEIDLDDFPLLKLWPLDGGKFITLPLITTRDPETGDLNLGIYRMMKLTRNSLCMHWLPQKHGNLHYGKAEKMGRDLPVAVSIGGDPALEVAGAFQLMPPLDEFMIAGLLRGRPVRVARAEDSDLWIPAGAEIVFEGVVRPGERAEEGPFGEFHGYYSPVKQTPVFHVEKVTMRRDPIWHAATTGPPPTEIHNFTRAMERVGLVIAKQFFAGLVDFNLTVESGTLYTMIVAMNKTRPYEAQELMHFLWSVVPQNTYVTNLIVVDADIDIRDLGQVLWAVSIHLRPDQDVMITPPGMADMEKPSTFPRGVGAKMGLDATTKWPEEGLRRPMPARVRMDDTVLNDVDRNWERYGFSR